MQLVGCYARRPWRTQGRGIQIRNPQGEKRICIVEVSWMNTNKSRETDILRDNKSKGIEGSELPRVHALQLDSLQATHNKALTLTAHSAKQGLGRWFFRKLGAYTPSPRRAPLTGRISSRPVQGRREAKR